MAGQVVTLASGNVTGNQTAVAVDGGTYSVSVAGSNLSGNVTVAIQQKDPAGNYVQNGSTFSAAGVQTLTLPPGVARASVSGNLTGAAVYATKVPSSAT